MSRGLGTFQRELIEAAGATCTIWDLVPDGVTATVADTKAVTALGVTTRLKDGWTWRKTGEPWFCAELEVRDRDSLLEARSLFKDVELEVPKDLDLLPCLWSLHQLRAKLFPRLWRADDMREMLPNTNGHYFPMIPDEIKRARNSAKVRMSKAIKSLERRGIVGGSVRLSCVSTSPDVEALDARWKERHRVWYGRGHNAIAVLDPRGTVSAKP